MENHNGIFFTCGSLLLHSVLYIPLSQDNPFDLLILHMSRVCKTPAFTLLLK